MHTHQQRLAAGLLPAARPQHRHVVLWDPWCMCLGGGGALSTPVPRSRPTPACLLAWRGVQAPGMSVMQRLCDELDAALDEARDALSDKASATYLLAMTVAPALTEYFDKHFFVHWNKLPVQPLTLLQVRGNAPTDRPAGRHTRGGGRAARPLVPAALHSALCANVCPRAAFECRWGALSCTLQAKGAALARLRAHVAVVALCRACTSAWTACTARCARSRSSRAGRPWWWS